MMTPHGPDKECFEKASNVENLVPERVADDTMVCIRLYCGAHFSFKLTSVAS